MDLEKVREILTVYEAELKEKGHKAVRADDELFASLLHTSVIGNHLLWMCEQVDKTYSDTKAMRWLGFIQGVLWILGRKSIKQMKEENRPEGDRPPRTKRRSGLMRDVRQIFDWAEGYCGCFDPDTIDGEKERVQTIKDEVLKILRELK